MVDIRASRGARIRQAISDSGKSQREIADLIGVAPQSITKWIKTGKIYIDNLESLAKVTGVDMRYIVSGYAPHNISEPAKPYNTARSDLIALIDQLDDQQTRKLLICGQALNNSGPELEVAISIGSEKV